MGYVYEYAPTPTARWIDGLGYVLADNMARSGGPFVLMFLLGFGGVHIPAALILLFKRAAGAGKS